MHRKWRDLAAVKKLRKHLRDGRSNRSDPASQVNLAERLGVTPGLVYFWTIGHRRPGHELRVALKRIARIDPAEWLTAAEREAADKLRAA